MSCESKVRPRTFGCVAMGSAVLFNLRSRLFLYSAGSGVNTVQVVLSGFGGHDLNRCSGWWYVCSVNVE